MEAVPIAVRHSVLDERALATMLTEDYELRLPVTCHLVRLGAVDDYRVFSGGRRHALRIWPAGWRDEAASGWEIDLAAALAAAGSGVATPVARHDDRRVSRLEAPEGLRPAVLVLMPAGEPLRPEAGDWQQLGTALATLHRAADGLSSAHPRAPLDLDHLVGPTGRALEPLLRGREDDAKVLRSALGGLAATLEAAADKLDWGPCHGAATGADAVVHDGRVAFTDLSRAAPAWRVWDLATARLAAHRVGGADLADAVGAGYVAERPLVGADLDVLDAVSALRVLWEVGQAAAAGPRVGLADAEASWAATGAPVAQAWA
jgi:Ser/Thr protein kinase RdoA (MazF antagonist)